MTSMKRLVDSLALAGIGAALVSGVGNARIIEELVEVPVEVKDVKGSIVRHTIRTSVYHDDSRAQSPFLILNHGRAVDDTVRRQLRLDAYTPHIKYFVSRGFAVLTPMRVGYGATGGPDVENSGSCEGKVYPPVYEAGAQQSLAVIAVARTRPYIDPHKGLVVGQSMVVVAGTVAALVAIAFMPKEGTTKSIMERGVTVASILSAGTLGLFFLGFLTRSATRTGCYAGIIACLIFTAWGILSEPTNPRRIDFGFNFTMNPILIGVFGHFVLFGVGYLASLILGGYRPEDVDQLTFRWKTHRRDAEMAEIKT